MERILELEKQLRRANQENDMLKQALARSEDIGRKLKREVAELSLSRLFI